MGLRRRTKQREAFRARKASHSPRRPVIVNFNAAMTTTSRVLTAEEFLRAGGPNPGGNYHKGPRDHSNELARHELYLLGPGEKKVIEEPDTSKLSFRY